MSVSALVGLRKAFGLTALSASIPSHAGAIKAVGENRFVSHSSQFQSMNKSKEEFLITTGIIIGVSWWLAYRVFRYLGEVTKERG